MKRILASIALFTVLQMTYVNCGRVGFEANKGSWGNLSLNSAACDEILLEAYEKTYFPLLSTHCNSCHSSAHGSQDLLISYQGFRAKTISVIDARASTPHGGNSVNLTQEIQSLKPQWNAGQEQYMSCLATARPAEPVPFPGDGTSLKLNAKAVPSLASTLASPNSWKAVEWDLETEVPLPQMNSYPGIFKMEARYAQENGKVLGIEFRNPSLRLKASGQALAVRGLFIHLNGKARFEITAFQDISASVSSTSATALAPETSLARVLEPQISSDVKVAFEFGDIQKIEASGPSPAPEPPPAPAQVTFTQLTSTDASLGVFRTHCFSCHTGSSPRAGLNLSDYTQAKAKANLILSTMQGTGSAMPPQGPLSQSEIDRVANWVNGGTPR